MKRRNSSNKGTGGEVGRALVAHELCHGEMSDKGSLRVVKHDLEEFGFVVRKYGAWQQSIALFDKQLAMFEPSFGTSSALEGSQTTMPDEADLRPTGAVNAAALRGEAERSSALEPTPLRPRRAGNGRPQPPAPPA